MTTQYISDLPQSIGGTDQSHQWNLSTQQSGKTVIKSSGNDAIFILEGGVYTLKASISTEGDVNSNATIEIRFNVNGVNVEEGRIFRTTGFIKGTQLRFDTECTRVLNKYDFVRVFVVAFSYEDPSYSPRAGTINTLTITKAT
jgi:hypothetical protein